ncbi:MAG: hypothetical protein ACI9R3_002501 [Verrucomicrobiales bacterium]|jgi:hypothetical protein
MNSKSLGILIGILAAVVIGVLAVGIMNKGSIEGGSKQAGAKVLEGLSPDNVKSMTIENKDGGTTLELGDNSWTVKDRDNYPAKFSEVRDLIWKVWELAIVEGITAGPSTHGRFQLIKPGTDGADEDELGTVVTFKGEGDKDLGTLVIGKSFEGAPKENTPSPFPGFQMGEKGTFVWSPSAADTVWRVKEDFVGINAKPSDWLNQDFIGSNSIKSVSVTHPDGDTWKVFREAKGGTLALMNPAEGEELDSSKATSSGNVFASPRFQDVLPAADKDKAGLDSGIKATVETFDGFNYELMVGNEVGDGSSATDRYLSFTISYQQPDEPNYEVEIAAKMPPSTAPEGETEEDKVKREADDQSKRDAERKRLEEGHKEDMAKAKEKLELEKSYAERVYIVTNGTVSGLLKKRAELLKEEEAAEDGATTPGASAVTPPVMVPGFGGGGAGSAIPSGPSAVTAPVRVEIPQDEGAEE